VTDSAAEVTDGLRRLLTGNDKSVAMAALPVAVKWDATGQLKNEIGAKVNELFATVAGNEFGRDKSGCW